jgi:hypothetical protein
VITITVTVVQAATVIGTVIVIKAVIVTLAVIVTKSHFPTRKKLHSCIFMSTMARIINTHHVAAAKPAQMQE